jgi:hypothetical protein
MGDVITQIGDSLERIFRYMLPGVCVLLACRLSHPSWFACIDYSESWQLLLLAVIAVCVGNVWYVVHRYTVHQLVDWFMYWICWRKKERKPQQGYNQWLIKHIAASFRLRQRLRQTKSEFRGPWPSALRSAQIIAMFIFAEIVLLCILWHEPDSWVGGIGNYTWFIVSAAVLMCFAIWQYYILFNVDIELVINPSHVTEDSNVRRAGNGQPREEPTN